MATGDNIIGKNIRKLRKLYGETQEELSKILGITQHAISQYERGKRVPEPDIIDTIVDHYSVSEESLTHKEIVLLNDSLLWEKIENSNYSEQLERLRATYPVVKTPKAMEDKDFAVALNLHTNLIEMLARVGANGYEIGENDCEIDVYKILDMYEKAERFIAAKANMISLYLIKYNIEFNNQAMGNAGNESDVLVKVAAEWEKLMLGTNNEQIREEYIKIAEEKIYGYLHDIKRAGGDFPDLADYLIIRLYSENIFEEGLSFEESRGIAEHLVRVAVRMKNKYALRLVKAIMPYIKDTE